MSIRQGLQEQNAGLGNIPKRASLLSQERRQNAASPQQQSSRHIAATTYGVHDESAPYTTRERHTQVPQADDYAGYDIPRKPSSARRYNQTQAVTKVTEEVPYPRKSLTLQSLLIAIGFVMLAGILLAFLLSTYIAPAWQNFTYTQAYGSPPRIYKTRANTGHGTRTNPDTQYIGINNGGLVEVIEIPTGTPTSDEQPHLYVIAHLTGQEAATVPITDISFTDFNGDGKPDMEVTVNNDTVYMLVNNGSVFKTQ